MKNKWDIFVQYIVAFAGIIVAALLMATLYIIISIQKPEETIMNQLDCSLNKVDENHSEYVCELN
jgi:lipopolysaccharide/colanic/teichoic acid biosynthesis glycosyltransferase